MTLRFIVAVVLAVLGFVPVVVWTDRWRRAQASGSTLALAISGGTVALVAAGALTLGV